MAANFALQTAHAFGPGAALSFNGAGQHVEVSNAPRLSVSGAITVEAWVRLGGPVSTNGMPIVEKFGLAQDQGGYALRIEIEGQASFHTLDYGDGLHESVATGSTILATNNWYHLAGSWDGYQLKVYVDGVLDGWTATLRNPKPGQTPLEIGNYGTNGNLGFNGLIDEVRIWDRALSQVEIQNLRYRALSGMEPGLIACWHFDDAAGQTATDATTNGFTGSLVNSPEWRTSTAPFSQLILPPIAAGEQHTLALRADGQVWAWGYNPDGRVGNGTIQSFTASPVPVGGLAGINAISAGGAHTVALRGDGSVWTWGNNAYGQLGDGTTTNTPNPVRVIGLGGICAISAGLGHTLALGASGTVLAWGRNNVGQLGRGFEDAGFHPIPIEVHGLSNVASITCGGFHSLALKVDGTVWAWGRNNFGQLGNGDYTLSSVPVQAAGLSNILAISAGLYHSLAVDAQGTIWAWGANQNGQLGIGLADFAHPLAVQVAGVGPALAVAGGGYHTLALATDHTVWSWGYNANGQLGDGTVEQNPTPTHIDPVALNNVLVVEAGGAHSVALDAGGTVKSWGANEFGELGLGLSNDVDPHPNPASVGGLGIPTIVTASPLTVGARDVAYSQLLLATNGVGPYTWTVVSGIAPAGLSLSPDGVIGGTPTATGTASFRVRATGADSIFAEKDFSLTVITLPLTIGTTNPLPPGIVGIGYTQALQAVGGVKPYSWAIVAGSLPAGLSLRNTGLISGVAIEPVRTDFTTRVTDSDSTSADGDFSLMISYTAPVLTSAPSITNSLWSEGVLPVILATEPGLFIVGATNLGLPLQYQWSFDDGVTTTLLSVPNVAHAFRAGDCGVHTARVMISDGLTSITNQLSVLVACPLSIVTLRADLDFKRTNNDKCLLAAQLDLGAEFDPTARTLTLVLGGAPLAFKLNAKGRGAAYVMKNNRRAGTLGSCQLTKSKSKTSAPGIWRLTATFAKGNFRDFWAAFGLKNDTFRVKTAQPPISVTLPVVASMGDEAFAGRRELIYAATRNKTGTAR